MDISRSLVTKIIDDGELNKALRSGITTDFLEEDMGQVFNYITRHFTEYKKVPSRDAVKLAFPNFVFNQVSEPLEYYISALQEAYRRNILEEKLNEIADIYSRDTKRAETLLRETLTSLHVTQKSFRDVDFASTVADRLRAYQSRKENPGANGILSNWPTLDYQTLGWQREEFCVFAAEKYMGKTWLMVWLAHQAALQGERVLFVTKEMSQDEVTRRLDSVYAQVEFDSLRRGELTHKEEKRYAEALEELSNTDYHFTIARQGVSTIEDIEIKAVETDATILFGDSIYLFDPDSKGRYSGEPQRRREVSTKCKAVAQALGIPFIVTVQAGRKKTKERVPDLDAIEWSNAFSQDANTVVFLDKTDLDKDLNRAHLYLLKSRDGQPTELFIDQNFKQMLFTERDDKIDPTTDVFEEDDDVVFDE